MELHNENVELTKEYKEEVEKNIVEVVIAELKGNNLEQSELPLIADFVLEKIDKIEKQDELLNFLQELSSRWPIFSKIEALEKGKVKDSEEDQVTRNVLNLAKTGKIEEAIDLAKTMTNI